MKTYAISFFIALLLLCLLGLENSEGYKGDGVLTDKGTLAATNRYVLDLGKIQLNRKGEYSYLMSDLPQVEMVMGLGITVDPSTTGYLKDKQFAMTIKMIITNGEGESVINEGGALRDWVWSDTPGMNHRFIYRRGAEKEIKSGDSSSSFKRTGVKADAGWGTYFTPRKHESYKIAITVMPTGNADSAQMAKVQVIGGGWK
jgi:hypothetical protein